MCGCEEGAGIILQGVLALDGDKSYMQSKEASEKTRINYEQGQHVTCVCVPVKE